MTGITTGVVRRWDRLKGIGVIDSDSTPGGCWVHFSHVEADGFAELEVGEAVELEWEMASQDSYRYRALGVRRLDKDIIADRTEERAKDNERGQ